MLHEFDRGLAYDMHFQLDAIFPLNGFPAILYSQQKMNDSEILRRDEMALLQSRQIKRTSTNLNTDEPLRRGGCIIGRRIELGEDLGVLTNHIRNRYILSFYPTSMKPGMHAIKVSVAHHPELLVSARSNYWSSDSTATEAQH